MHNIQQLHQQALALINQGQFVQAHPILVNIVKQQPQHADSYFLLGIINFEVGQVRKAIQLMQKAISLSDKAEYKVHLAKAFSLTGDMLKVTELSQQITAQSLSTPLELDTMGVALSRVGLHQQALAYFNAAIQLQQDNASFYYNLAVCHKFMGNFEQAELQFEQAINLEPNYHQAHFALSDLGNTNQQHNHIHRLEQCLQQAQPADAQLHLCHALAKEYESCKDYTKAFNYLQQGKRAKLNSLNYDFAQDQQIFRQVKALAEQYKTEQVKGCDNPEPIFILGMPRSGTTLVERIISNHSDVMSAGELQDFGVAVKELSATQSNTVLDTETLKQAYTVQAEAIGQRYIERTRAITGATPRFIDKLPFNFFYIDLIRRALPRAKIICLLRGPMDTCIGNYRQLFSINSPYYFYAYDLLTTGRFYAEFYHLAHYFQQHTPENFMLLDYQQLVAEPEPQIRNLLEFCQLEWQAKCLQVEKNDAPVSTASKVQVREPINSKSIGRWKKFQPYTNELEQLLTTLDVPLE